MVASPDVDAYIERSEHWRNVLEALRPILLEAGLDEAIKWNKPCYGLNGDNIAVVQEMKRFVALLFFKGVLLDDPDGLLQSQGPNTRAALRLQFTSVADVDRLREAIGGFVEDAIEIERAGLEVEPAPPAPLADELQSRLDDDATLKAAFEALTPGRQREYNLHVSGAKQSTTRTRRVDTCVPKILAGKGFRDR